MLSGHVITWNVNCTIRSKFPEATGKYVVVDFIHVNIIPLHLNAHIRTYHTNDKLNIPLMVLFFMLCSRSNRSNIDTRYSVISHICHFFTSTWSESLSVIFFLSLLL